MSGNWKEGDRPRARESATMMTSHLPLARPHPPPLPYPSSSASSPVFAAIEDSSSSGSGSSRVPRDARKYIIKNVTSILLYKSTIANDSGRRRRIGEWNAMYPGNNGEPSRINKVRWIRGTKDFFRHTLSFCCYSCVVCYMQPLDLLLLRSMPF